MCGTKLACLPAAIDFCCRPVLTPSRHPQATFQCDWPASAKCPLAEKPPSPAGPSAPSQPTGAGGGSQSVATTTAAPATAATEAGSAADTGYKVVCYFTNWSWYR